MLKLYYLLVEPGAPVLLEITDALEHTCTAQWNEPACDGGADIEGYILERREVKGTRWMRCSKKLIKELR